MFSVEEFEWGVKGVYKQLVRNPKKHISISILCGYPYLIGLHYEGVSKP